MPDLIYPSLPAHRVFGVLRIGGNGLGNCLFAYFHAVVMAKEHGGRVVAPTWWSVKIGPLLRRERSLRRYRRMVRPHPDEIAGIRKYLRLLWAWPTRQQVQIYMDRSAPIPRRNGLTIVDVPPLFAFAGLHPHRDLIRQRLLEILVESPTTAPRWGAGDYAAAHIRLGDFLPARSGQITGLRDGMRIPLAWYTRVIRRVRAIYPHLPVYIFSDGREHELGDILAINGVQLRREPSDIADLMALAEARLLIGSNSTFSRWAAFLGDMPSIWLKTEQPTEQPTGPGPPIMYIIDDFETVTRESVLA